MSYVVYVGYPAAAGARFDMKYYLSKHMPLVQSKWTSYGLENWSVTEFKDSNAPYCVQAVLHFKDQAAFGKASSDSEEVFGDIPQFTDLKPTLYHGEQVGAKSS